MPLYLQHTCCPIVGFFPSLKKSSAQVNPKEAKESKGITFYKSDQKRDSKREKTKKFPEVGQKELVKLLMHLRIHVMLLRYYCRLSRCCRRVSRLGICRVRASRGSSRLCDKGDNVEMLLPAVEMMLPGPHGSEFAVCGRLRAPISGQL